MNNRNIFILFLLSCMFLSQETGAQIMEWAINPNYKEIVCLGKDLYKVKGANNKWGIFNTSTGKLTVSAEYDNIGPLVDGRILILDAQGERLYGIVDEQGNPVDRLLPPIIKSEFVVMKDYPYFSDGLLAVGKQAKSSDQFYSFGYVDKQGNPVTAFDYYYASPFDNGQAMVYTKKSSYQIIDHQGNFTYVGNKKINFMSNPDNGVFVLVSGNNISKVKFERSKFITVEEIESGQVVNVTNATNLKRIFSKGPKGKTYFFDNAFHLKKDASAPNAVSPVKPKEESYGSLKKYRDGNFYGINYYDTKVLPGQFSDVKVYDNEYAVVTMENNNVGLLKFNSSGKISVDASTSPVVFYHNQEVSIPVNVNCQYLDSKPTIELAVEGDYRSRVFSCKGSGTINIPFYEAHSVIGKTTEKTIRMQISADGLKLGRKEITISSKHEAGFKIKIEKFPEYGNINNYTTVKVHIIPEGVPSESAMAKINGTPYHFNGSNPINANVKFEIPGGKIQLCKVSVEVIEDGCPTLPDSKSYTIKSYYLR